MRGCFYGHTPGGSKCRIAHGQHAPSDHTLSKGIELGARPNGMRVNISWPPLLFFLAFPRPLRCLPLAPWLIRHALPKLTHMSFEKMSLEGFQAGLSWITILRKRENFRAAFDGFDFRVVANYDDDDVARLLDDAGIVRHQGKIRSTINNAKRAVTLVEAEGSLARYVWSWEPSEREGDVDGEFTVPATTPTSTALAKDLKKRGWTFVGPTTVYAFMQAMGLVNDHVSGCDCRAVCEAEQVALVWPTPGG